MKALISPNEKVEDGFRIAEITEQPFEVAEPLFWVDCDSTVTTNMYYKDNSCMVRPSQQPAQPQPVIAVSATASVAPVKP